MGDTFYGISSYYKAFVSPVASYQVSPVTNLMYGAAATKIYSQTIAKKVQSTVSSYLTALNSNVNDLKAAGKALTSRGAESSFSKKAVSTSDGTAVSGKAAANADIAAYTLNISKLATAQVNTGKQLKIEDKSFNNGINTFSIKVGSNQEKNISFMIDEGDNNRAGLEKMAKAINNAKIGVGASVYTDSKAGTSYLKLTANATGTNNTIEVKDVRGNAVEISGADEVSTGAQNAEYTVDGRKYQDQQNVIHLNNNKVEVTLNKAEGKDIKLNVGTDAKAVKEDIEAMVKSYNTMISFADSYSGSIGGADKLKNEITGIVKARKSSLNSIGISMKDNGALSVDGKRLEKSISENLGRVKDIFGGYNGVAEKLYSKSNDIMNSPLQYSKPNDSADKEYSKLYNYMNGNNSMYRTQNMYTGLLFDSLL